MARHANSQREQYKLFAEAEKEMLKDPPVIILWYGNDFQLCYSRVRNLKINPMNFLDLREVYFKDWTKEEYLKTVQ
jgi:ABC-type transport system substrate-binding protein